MLIIMNPSAGADEIAAVLRAARDEGLHPRLAVRDGATVIACAPSQRAARLGGLTGVRRVEAIATPYVLASRAFQAGDTVVRVGSVEVGAEELVLMAGPCVVESSAELELVAPALRAAGARVLGGGALKPRASPYALLGLCPEGLEPLGDVGSRHGLPIVSEVMDPSEVAAMAERVDLLQVGAHNMQNFELLKALGQQRHPVMLRRGPSATIEEWLLAAEYILAGGNTGVILCEEGIRTFERATRNTLDLSAVAVVKAASHLPVIVDPSHAVGRRAYVGAMARAAVAAGADGLFIEVHPDPGRALCDGAQALRPTDLERLGADLAVIAGAVGRRFPGPAPTTERTSGRGACGPFGIRSLI
jgi:3-deoxy-7-phosphoheptulonate synthase